MEPGGDEYDPFDFGDDSDEDEKENEVPLM